MPTEKTVAAKLVAAAIASGYCLSVNDGEAWTVKRSRNKAAILAALETTGEDILRVRDNATAEMIGDISLIWGNAPDGSELVSDHTDTPAMAALIAKAE
jgi:hypothetical protein